MQAANSYKTVSTKSDTHVSPPVQDNSGTIERDEFLSLPQVSSNPLATRMIAIFDEDGGGDVDFQEFVSGLSAFSSKGNKEEKLRFAFKVYDIDRDGFISNGELFIVLKMMVGSNLKDQQLQQIVDKTIMEADLDHDGKISFEEFTKMVENTDVSMSMTLGAFFFLVQQWLSVADFPSRSILESPFSLPGSDCLLGMEAAWRSVLLGGYGCGYVWFADEGSIMMQREQGKSPSSKRSNKRSTTPLLRPTQANPRMKVIRGWEMAAPRMSSYRCMRPPRYIRSLSTLVPMRV